MQERQQAHVYLDLLPPEQLSAVRSLLETMLPDPVSRVLANAPVEDEEISEKENEAVVRSKEWFKANPGNALRSAMSKIATTPTVEKHILIPPHASSQ